jgi:flavin reductase (DIM6/NTAB) family NADH-FMN oxidoreductase RutF
MFYEPGQPHGLSHDPFKACVVPRPIGWISSRLDGHDNLAPYSQFTNVNFDPAIVMFSSNQNLDGRRKDSVNNAEQSGVFVWNQATWAQREAVNITAEQVEPDVDEFERAGLGKEQATLIDAPMVVGSPVRFECEYLQTLRLPGNGLLGTVDVVFGRVVGIHIADEALTDDGLIDVLRTRPIARMGYFSYTSVESTFDMIVPGDPRAMIGLEGSVAGHRTL